MKLFNDIIDILNTIYENPHARVWVRNAAISFGIFSFLIGMDMAEHTTPLRYLPDIGKKIISFPGNAKAM